MTTRQGKCPGKLRVRVTRAVRGASLALGVAVSSATADAPRWDWQLSKADLSVTVSVLDLEPELVRASDVAALKARSVFPIAYISVGTLENWSPDVADFPARVIGKTYGDWPDERFLDIRQRDVLVPLMKARFARAKALGFEAIEPDNLDLHINDTGFDLTASDVVAYTRALAEVAHGMGLEIGQKNVPDLTPDLMPYMDFAVTESCYQDGWCAQMAPYWTAGKPVYDAEYADRPINWKKACDQAQGFDISMILKDRDLTAAALKSCQ